MQRDETAASAVTAAGDEVYGKPFHGWSCDCDECRSYDERGEPRPGEAPKVSAAPVPCPDTQCDPEVTGHAVAVLPGESTGVEMELTFARARGIPIYSTNRPLEMNQLRQFILDWQP